jgi:N-methylhydantoinase B
MNLELQVIGAGLRSIADEMGAALVRSAFSANIKERRDCSTALFDAHGRMIAQAEHIPVHLGAMPDAAPASASRSRARTMRTSAPASRGACLPNRDASRTRGS